MENIIKRALERRSGAPLGLKIGVPIVALLGIFVAGLLIYKALSSDRNTKKERHMIVTPAGRPQKASIEEEELPRYPATTEGPAGRGA
jgi:hypothetical protein